MNLSKICSFICIVLSVCGLLACESASNGAQGSARKDSAAPNDNPPSLEGAWETDCHKYDDAYRVKRLDVKNNKAKYVQDFFSDEDCKRQTKRFVSLHEFKILGGSDDVKDTLEIDMECRGVTIKPMTDEEATRVQNVLRGSGDPNCKSVTLTKGVASDATKCAGCAANYSIVRINDDEIRFGDCEAAEACVTEETRASRLDANSIYKRSQ